MNPFPIVPRRRPGGERRNQGSGLGGLAAQRPQVAFEGGQAGAVGHQDRGAAPDREASRGVGDPALPGNNDNDGVPRLEVHRGGVDSLGPEELIGPLRQQPGDARPLGGAGTRGPQANKPASVPSAVVERAKRDIEPKAQVAVPRAVDREACPLEQDREVRRLLQLHQGDSRADGVRHPGRHQAGVAGRDGDLVERVQDGGRVLVVDPAPDDGGIGVLLEAEVNVARAGVAALVPGLQDEPRLGLAVARAEEPGGEVAVGVEVHDEALPRVEDLDEQRRVDAVAGDVIGPEEAVRVRRDRVAQRLPAVEMGQADTRPPEHLGGGPDPVLGRVRGRLGDAAQPRDARAAPVEVRGLVRAEDDRYVGHDSHDRSVAAGGKLPAATATAAASSSRRRCSSERRRS